MVFLYCALKKSPSPSSCFANIGIKSLMVTAAKITKKRALQNRLFNSQKLFDLTTINDINVIGKIFPHGNKTAGAELRF